MTALAANPLVELASRGLVIGDGRVASPSGGSAPHYFAGTGEIQAEIPLAGTTELDQAVAAAREASGEWRRLAGDRRGQLLMRLADLIEEHADELSVLETLECGRPVSETSNDVAMLAGWTRYFAGWTDKIQGSVVSLPTGSTGLDYVQYEPYGVVGAITPFNIPLSAIGMKITPAMAAGNTVVAKPSDKTPFTALRIAELALEAGIPSGVLNVVTGAADIGDRLVRHPDVAKISFTGGLGTAGAIMHSAAETAKPLHFELGGKSANIIFADANLDAAVPFSLMLGAIMLAGQGCILPTRLFVQDGVYDDVQRRLLDMVGNFPVGDPLDRNTMVGPVISAESADRIVGVIERAKQDGATLLHGGERLGGDLAGGYFISPTLFGDVDNSSSLAQKEVFGPVLSIIRFSDEDDVIEMANATDYGLFSYVHTQNLSRAHRLAESLESGQVSVNGLAVPPGAPFGGVKQSGFGSEGGEWGLKEFLRPKNVYIAY